MTKYGINTTTNTSLVYLGSEVGVEALHCGPAIVTIHSDLLVELMSKVAVLVKVHRTETVK